MLGLRALAVGWSGIFAAVFGWYANPALALALVFAFLKKPTLSMICAAIAIAIACTVLIDLGRELPGDEGGVTKTTIVRVLPGFYIWIGSMAVLFLQRFWK
jgi:hypothetical protein